MTFFSSMALNAQKRGGRKLLTSPQAMHAAVMSAFEPGTYDDLPGRILWRVDSDGPAHRLYVVSPTKPDLTHVVEQAGWVGQEWQTAHYDPFLDRLRTGQEWDFRLTANPVIRKNQPGERGKIMPHKTVKSQTEWLTGRAAGWGFEIPPFFGAERTEEDSIPNVRVTGRHDARFSRESESRRRKQPEVSIRQVQYEGTLRITDATRLREHLLCGMGRGKAYGCGLMTLRRGD